MGVEEFLELFAKELEGNVDLRRYYRLLNNKYRHFWRKAYLEQRLQYVTDKLTTPKGNIWDVGCGYGTTSIFLALNGFQVTGNTLEFYYDNIENRLEYWSKFGDLSTLRFLYANLYDMPVATHSFDAIIAQDTLHHLEPIDNAIDIFIKALKPGGRLIAIEENGNNLFINLKNFSTRGFKKVTEYYDPHLQKTILIGNENARGLSAWRRIINNHGMRVLEKETAYIRFFPPFCFTKKNYRSIQEKEKTVAGHFPFLKEVLYFGINFTAVTKES